MPLIVLHSLPVSPLPEAPTNETWQAPVTAAAWRFPWLVLGGGDNATLEHVHGGVALEFIGQPGKIQRKALVVACPAGASTRWLKAAASADALLGSPPRSGAPLAGDRKN